MFVKIGGYILDCRVAMMMRRTENKIAFLRMILFGGIFGNQRYS